MSAFLRRPFVGTAFTASSHSRWAWFLRTQWWSRSWPCDRVCKLLSCASLREHLPTDRDLLGASSDFAPTRIRALLLVLLLVLFVVVATRCGGDDAEEETAAAQAAAEDLEIGIAAWNENGCGLCHTLAAVGHTATIGPDLDESLQGRDAAYVERAIIDPDADIAEGYEAGNMPKAFDFLLSDEELAGLVALLTPP